MTLSQIVAYHVKAHTGFVWACPHCKDAYWKAMTAQAERNGKG
jgi:hypothetical protein